MLDSSECDEGISTAEDVLSTGKFSSSSSGVEDSCADAHPGRRSVLSMRLWWLGLGFGTCITMVDRYREAVLGEGVTMPAFVRFRRNCCILALLSRKY
jgi:hypothetical protein